MPQGGFEAFRRKLLVPVRQGARGSGVRVFCLLPTPAFSLNVTTVIATFFVAYDFLKGVHGCMYPSCSGVSGMRAALVEM